MEEEIKKLLKKYSFDEIVQAINSAAKKNNSEGIKYE